MKKLVKVLVVLIVLVLVAVVAGFVYMDTIATKFVKEAVAFATECEVTIGKVDVKPMSGEVTITDLDIKNPQTFREIQDSFLVLESASAEVSLGTLRSDLVEAPNVSAQGAVITLVGRDGKTNYETILESLKRFQGEEASEVTEEEAKQFIARLAELTDARVIVDMDEDPLLGAMAVELELELQPISLKDVGSGGVPLSQLSADLIADILVQVVAQLGTQLGDRVLSGLTSGLAGVLGPDALQQRLTDITSTLGLENISVSNQLARAAELGTAVFEGAGELIDGAGGALEGIGDGAGGLLEGAGGLLGGDDEDGAGDEDEGGLLDGARGLLGGDDE